jgi:hypothetical protein
MRTAHGRPARVPRVPNFEANDRLKFTAEEQEAIQAAERAFGYRPQSNMVVRPRPNRGLAFAIVTALAYFLFSSLVAAFFHSFLPPESPRESPMVEAIQREPQSQEISDSGTFKFENEATIDQSPEVTSHLIPEPSADDPAGAQGQITPAGPSSDLPTQVTGEEK